MFTLQQYGVIVFRSTGMTDLQHVGFSRRFGDLDDIRPYMTSGRKPRYEFYELFDAGNIDFDTGDVLDPTSPRAQYNKGNALFHVDSSFNPRRASYSLLKATELAPPGNGGDTMFADTRTAWDDLPDDMKQHLLDRDYVGAHSLHHSRKTAAPEFFKDVDPTQFKMHRHRLVQKHEPSGRHNLYIAAHCHHIEGLEPEKSSALLKELTKHATQEKYVVSVPWENPGDVIIWDNTCVMHRSGPYGGAGKYKRDLRRTTVHDSSSQAWGLNEPLDSRPGFNMPSGKLV
jgi:alpha-ketoglutarate-dependent 2,4-dichlorophenoxyacetate dioxygenase